VDTDTGTGFPPSTSVLSCQYHFTLCSTNALHSSHTNVVLTRTNREKPKNAKTNALSEIGGLCIEKYFTLKGCLR
jgi:hypothetical protein